MRYCAALPALGLALVIATVAPSEAPPKPSLVPVSWQLEFEYQPPQHITLRLPGEPRAERFWYMLYAVTNLTRADQIFVPEFVLYADTGQVMRAADHIPPGVFNAIQRRHNNPLLLDMASITGRILQGEDNAKDGVAIWRDLDPKARAFDVFIAGLSGERARVVLPTTTAPVEETTGPATQPGEDNQAILSKTLRLHYTLAGEAAARERTVAKLALKEWVMR